MATIATHGPRCGTTALCRALGVPPATYYRSQQPRVLGPWPRRRSVRRLTPAETQTVLDVLHAPRFVDLAPAEVYATLLDEGRYHCAERTMYRVLATHAEVRERRAVARHPIYAAPELLATGPKQLWSWDITKLKGPAKWTWYHLYVLLDVFSRYVVGWLVAPHESATLAERLLATSYARQGIRPGQLTVHADRGSAMVAKSVALLLAELGVTKTHARPHVCDDNPFSESTFKTLKYHPDFPERFGSLEDARTHCTAFFTWYNTAHRHSGIGLHTPAAVHFGLAPAQREARADVLAAAYARTPERFVRQLPQPPRLPTAAWINPPKPRDGLAGIAP